MEHYVRSPICRHGVYRHNSTLIFLCHNSGERCWVPYQPVSTRSWSPPKVFAYTWASKDDVIKFISYILLYVWYICIEFITQQSVSRYWLLWKRILQLLCRFFFPFFYIITFIVVRWERVFNKYTRMCFSFRWAILYKIKLFWDFTLCMLVNNYQRFEVSFLDCLTLKIWDACFSETSVTL